MKSSIKTIKILIVLGIIAAATAIPKYMRAEEKNYDSEEMFQTWEKFLESGVQIEYDTTTAPSEDL